MKPGERCLVCGQIVPEKGRICGRCRKHIGKHDKYHFEDGLAVHDDCSNPTVKQ
jgi:predicted amidophosphoribosyltransferase